MTTSDAALSGNPALRHLTLALTARVPAAGIADFQAYEAAVLPLLARHGGSLERRLRNGDGTFELHIVSFSDRSGLEAFRSDPDRVAAQPLLARSGAIVELVEAADVA
jgi:hypothetical protein